MVFDFGALGGNFDEKMLEPQKIPTYEEWLDSQAKALETHPAFVLIRNAFRLVRYTNAREAAFLSILESRGMWGPDDTELLDTRTEECSKEMNKELVRKVARAASQGEVKFPGLGGKEVNLTPDNVVSAINEFLINEDRLTGRSVEILSSFLGQDEEQLRAQYDAATKQLEVLNSAKEGLRDIFSGGFGFSSKESEKDPGAEERRKRAERRRRKSDYDLYELRCKLFGKPMPSAEDKQAMLDGDKPIPGLFDQ